ncbi:peptidase M23, partial [Candidatus Pelagibacter communis]|uniref:peptidase M23 n=1 Tax=Pelagibacter ubique TaxID=198252 RepID=UPI00094C06E1
MINKIKIKIKNKNEILALILLMIITVTFTNYYNYTKKKIKTNYNEIINNVYFKKTANHFLDKLEPKFKKIRHQISEGETFDKILNSYSIKKNEIQNLKIKLSQKINLNRLNTNQKIYLTIDQSNNQIKNFIFQISNKERILLKRNEDKNNFSQEIILTKLDKKIIYQENTILQSLYRSAIEKKIPANTIIELARIYGFQVDFQRDIRKKDRFQIMYEIFIDENEKTIEIGNILYANLILSGEDNSLYYFDKEGSVGHYDKNGKSVKKALMKTPINGARLSSPFGM